MSAFTLAVILQGCGKPPVDPPPPPPEATEVGFVYIGEIGDYGWSKAHEDGRQYVENFGNNVKTRYVANVAPEGRSRPSTRSTRRAAASSSPPATTSWTGAKAATAKYPDLTVLNCAGFQTAERLGSYQTRVEEVEYLSGIVAGRMTRSNKIAVIATQRIYEVIMHVNAFTLGVRSVNPDAEVLVRYVGFWIDPAKEVAAVDEFHAQGVDVFKNLTDTNLSIQRADALGAWSVSHGSKDGCAVAPDTCLVTSYYNWGPLYVKLIDDLVAGTYPLEGRIDYTSNAELETSGLSAFAAAVPQAVRDEVAVKKAAIAAGTFNIFQGPYRFDDGTQVAEGARLTDEQLICTSRHVEGVTLVHGPACTVKADCRNEVLGAELMDCVDGLCVAPDLGGCPG